MKRLAPVLAAGAALLAGAAQAQPASWSAPGEPLQIGDNLYYVGTEGIAAPGVPAAGAEPVDER